MNLKIKWIIIFGIIIIGVISYFLFIQKLNDTIQIKGTFSRPLSSWSPSFDEECISSSPILETLDKDYYLDGLCSPFGFPYDDYYGKKVVVSGNIEERILDVPLRKELNPPTEKQTFTVINVKDIKLVE